MKTASSLICSFNTDKSVLQRVFEKEAKARGVEIWMKRDDLVDEWIQGNKWRKLKYQLIDIIEKGEKHIATFGGPFSNHIYSTAAACKMFGIKCTIFVRGNYHEKESDTILFVRSCGATVVYLSIEEYRKKDEYSLQQQFGPFVLIPEGGTCAAALKGVEEMVREINVPFNFICCGVGTGGTIAGISKSIDTTQKVIGFSSLKGESYLDNFIFSLSGKRNFIIDKDYQFGGYAKMTNDLFCFTEEFKKDNGFGLDPVYTSKMMYGIRELLRADFFSRGDVVVAVHSGGMQGWCGFKDKFGEKNKLFSKMPYRNVK